MSLVLEAIQNHPPSCLALMGDAQGYTYGDLKEEIARRVDIMSDVFVLGLALDNGSDWVLWDLASPPVVVICDSFALASARFKPAHGTFVTG